MPARLCVRATSFRQGTECVYAKVGLTERYFFTMFSTFSSVLVSVSHPR